MTETANTLIDFPEKAKGGQPPLPHAPDPRLEALAVRYKNDMERTRALASSTEPSDEAEANTIYAAQEERLEQAIRTQAQSMEGLLSKLDLWYLDRLAGGEDMPEDDADRLVLSIRRDAARLVESGRSST